MIDAILKETLPLLPIRMKAPQFGCSAFATVLDRHIVMGRNYDFKNDSSAMLVYCTPKDGYKSVALAALDENAGNYQFLWLLCLFSGAKSEKWYLRPRKRAV